MNARIYARALSRIPSTVSAADAVAGLMRSLKSKGRLKLLPQILREMAAEEGKRLATRSLVEVASTDEAVNALAEARKAGIDAHEAVITPSLIKGWRARGNGMLIDRSGKHNLVELYRKITS